VTYRLNPDLAPDGYLTDVRQALAQLAAATGLRLIPATGSADIAISWDPTLYDPVPGTTGEAGETNYRTVTGLSGPHVATASVRISSHLSAAGAAGVGEEPVLLHELGHAVGLGHHSGPVVMNPVDQGFHTYQSGDLAGLSALYHPASCGAS
jgi:predicted Zn-dependent protease